MKRLLRGERVKLSSITKEDLPYISEWYEDTTFSRKFDALASQPKSIAKLEKWLEGIDQTFDQFTFAIRDIQNDKLIGYVELDGILWSQRNGWVSIAIGNEAYRSQGYGTEAMRLLIDFAFNECNLHRVHLTVFDYNEPAKRLYEKLGFTHEGAHREFIIRDGKTYDMHLYGLLKHEWK
ncbi:GNAT family N-acetyltransferase [Thalassobacillus hwangdonensis]|uniref:GNAT family N-acetyltransferase n=1 Tax=Thalassobacillus hwangdonensis TaxID=546108 RepID=A0ABW3L6G7_9BACI